ncbi:major facilitator superfamily protein [Actinidia rufa]|uniref:Major facilitator superfamily protein n=1 Tax=Actinidia rufa TaxID=165716 RepID=A0A7J0ERL4_9ERIC|nr:major facilitator superfamily protein [Actinidia rufa]
MTIQAHDPRLLPNPCGKSSCVSGGKAAILYGSLCLLALGSGGVKGALPPLGADQFDKRDPREAKALGSYFNYLLFSTTIGAAIGVTVIVWQLGFWCLDSGSPSTASSRRGRAPFSGLSRLSLYHSKTGRCHSPRLLKNCMRSMKRNHFLRRKKISHTNQFRCLDKAAILQEEAKPTSWKVCTVTQVEEVKVLTRMLPIIASTILMNTCMAQLQTFSVQQGNRMGRLLGSFEVPAPSIPVIPLAFMAVLIPIYEFIFVPFARKLTGHPSGITQLQRVGVGLVLSAVSMAVAALVEVKRRNQSIKSPLEPISLFWLSFQYGIFGIADMFTLVGLLEFFYKEAPACMRSLSTSFTWISLSLGYFLSSVFIDIINSVTKRLAPSKQGWLHGQDLDKNHLDLFYWFLSILSCLNFFNYLYWASWYKYKTEEPKMEPMIRFKEGSPVEGLSRNSTNGGPSVEDKKEDAKEEKEQVGEAQ